MDGAATTPPLLPAAAAAAQPSPRLPLLPRSNAAAAPPPQNVWAGWSPDDPASPCDWENVACDGEGHVESIIVEDEERGLLAHGASSTAPPAAARPLVPALASLRWLRLLRVMYRRRPVLAGLPPEWCQPGAFPRLAECVSPALAAGRLRQRHASDAGAARPRPLPQPATALPCRAHPPPLWPSTRPCGTHPPAGCT